MLKFLKSTFKGKIKPMVLLILDGWGIAPASHGNAITQAKTPNYDRYISEYPHAELIAAGESVGLPANEAGNSEVGHLTIGTGQTIYQSLPRINMAIEDGSFNDNKAFLSAIDHVKKNNSKLHIMGLISSGCVHSSIEHLYALLDFCGKKEIQNVNLHLFTDGRDAPPNDGEKVLREIDRKLKDTNTGVIRTLCGRYYAMDRNGKWERTKLAYDAIVSGIGKQSSSALETIQASYREGKTDEFVEPTVIVEDSMVSRLGPHSAKQSGTVDDNDAVIFFNFRIDRPRQLTMAFVFPDFENLKSIEFGYVPHQGKEDKKKKAKISGGTFKRSKLPKNIFFVSMTEYQKNLPVSAIAYPPPIVSNSLPKVISESGLNQLHLAESEKERMVSFYLDGMKEERFKNEDIEIISSPNVSTYDKKPEMSVFKLVKKFNKLLRKDKYHLYMLNFANPDMVAHSGSLPATISAVEAVDKALGELVESVLAQDGTIAITADHGNAEELLTFPTSSFFITTSEGSINTEHSSNPVPFLIINNQLRGRNLTLPKGNLADVAPTILALMGLEKPVEMTGRNLLSDINTGQAPTKVNPEEPRQNLNQPISPIPA